MTMHTYACILWQTETGLQVPCGTDAYVQLDGRMSAHNALHEATTRFAKRWPTARHVAVFRAPSLGHKGRVVATFPTGRERLYEPAVNEGCYK